MGRDETMATSPVHAIIRRAREQYDIEIKHRARRNQDGVVLILP